MKYTRSILKHDTMRSFKETCLCKFFSFNFINKFVGEIYSVAPIKKVRVKPNLKLCTEMILAIQKRDKLYAR